MRPEYEGLILLSKPPGLTSFQSLGEVKGKISSRRVGHTGTLDKFAEGLLLVLTGRTTKLAPFFTNLNKEYSALIKLGEETDTLDPEGEVVRTGVVPDLDTISVSLDRLKGTINQIPPVYSAVHVNGARASAMARQGKRFSLEPREVTIYCMNMIDYTPPYLKLFVRCSKGTYIRSLARDLGKMANTCAHVKTLKRIGVGKFKAESAVSAGEFDPNRDIIPADRFIAMLDGIGRLDVKNRDFSRLISNGITPQDSFFRQEGISDGIYFLFDEDAGLLAVSEKEDNVYRYHAVLGLTN